jgi:hypothetical protein
MGEHAGMLPSEVQKPQLGELCSPDQVQLTTPSSPGHSLTAHPSFSARWRMVAGQTQIQFVFATPSLLL